MTYIQRLLSTNNTELRSASRKQLEAVFTKIASDKVLYCPESFYTTTLPNMRACMTLDTLMDDGGTVRHHRGRLCTEVINLLRKYGFEVEQKNDHRIITTIIWRYANG